MPSLPVLSLLVAQAAAAADPLFDAGLHGFTAAAGGAAQPMPLDQAGRAGVALMGWPGRQVGLGVRLDGGSYGIYSRDATNAFAFAEGQVRFGERWSGGLGLGTPIAWLEYACEQGACEEGLWERHHPIAALTGTWNYEKGAFHLPISARIEASAARWAVGVDVGIGLRAHRKPRG